jgi:hypothetical protein
VTAEAESADRRVARPFQVPKDAAEAVALLEDNRIERVHVGIFDLDGVFREQRLPIDQAKRASKGTIPSATSSIDGTPVNPCLPSPLS